MVNESLFSYKYGNSFLHRCQVWIKLLFIPIISIFIFVFPPYVCWTLILFQFALSLFLKFSFFEIINDLRPVFYYFILLLIVEIFSVIYEIFPLILSSDFYSSKICLMNHFSWQTQKDSIYMLGKIFCLFQTTSLMFKTTSNLQIKECLEKIKFLSGFAAVLSMFINFIPLTSKIWNQTKKAWLARGGKKGIKMYFILLPVLFSLGMKKSWNMSRAMEIRAK